MGIVAFAISRLPRPWLKAAARLRHGNSLLASPLTWVVHRLARADGVIPCGVGQGLRFNAGQSHLAYGLGTAEPAVQKALQLLLRPGMVAYDVGSNVGFLSVIMARLVGPTGQVICFDPLPANAQQTAHNARINGFGNMVVRQEAICDHDGMADLSVLEDPTWCILAKLDRADVVATINVPMRTIDSLVQAQQTPPPDLIKLDIERAEVGAIMGATQVLEKSRPLVLVELHDTQQWVLPLLEKARYQVCILGKAAPAAAATGQDHVLAIPQEHPNLSGLTEQLQSLEH